jgi:hypothetical protein
VVLACLHSKGSLSPQVIWTCAGIDRNNPRVRSSTDSGHDQAATKLSMRFHSSSEERMRDTGLRSLACEIASTS